MNILFLSLAQFNSINERGIYSDLLREMMYRGHEVYVCSPIERRCGKPSYAVDEGKFHQLRVRTLNIRKTNAIEKGIGMLLLEYQFDRMIQKYWGNIDFDMILYATPPITFNRVIARQKNRTKACTYLMLKDIFPQNAVDLGMFSKRSYLYRMFRKKEKRLYAISDRIGCMSPANVAYLKKHNPEIPESKIEICPNAVELVELPTLSEESKRTLLGKYGVPADKTLFIYGGNLGKPQGLDFLLATIKENESRNGSFIVVVGNGTEYSRVAGWFEAHKPMNAKLLSSLPKQEYDNLVRCCDVGLIFLDPRFTIPNFPSRLLSYLEYSMPIIAATDTNCDTGILAEENGFGIRVISGDLTAMMAAMDRFTKDHNLMSEMGAHGYEFLCANYTVKHAADKIENAIV